MYRITFIFLYNTIMWRVKDQYIDMMNESDYWMSEWYDIHEYIILEIINNSSLQDLCNYFTISPYLSNDEKMDDIIDKLEWKSYFELTLIYKQMKW